MFRILIYALLTFFIQSAFNNNSYSMPLSEYNTEQIEIVNTDTLLHDSLTKKEFTKVKLTAITLAITLGVFGVHRLYLGTRANIPIIYTLTLGGGFFLLPIIDIVYILTAKDINQIQNNDYVFMWNKKKKEIKSSL